MLQDCVNHLAPIAPEAAETRKAMAILQAQMSGGAVLGRVAGDHGAQSRHRRPRAPALGSARTGGNPRGVRSNPSVRSASGS